MAVRISVHPPLAITVAASRPSGEGLAHLHAALWLEVWLPELEIRRRGHLQLLRGLEPGTRWWTADLGGRPRTPAPGDVPGLPESAAEDLECWLTAHELVLYCVPQLGAVSELGESREDFSARVRALLRPELMRRMETAEVESRRSLAGTTGRLARAVEEVVVVNLAEQVQAAELGILVIPARVPVGEARGAPVLRRRGSVSG